MQRHSSLKVILNDGSSTKGRKPSSSKSESWFSGPSGLSITGRKSSSLISKSWLAGLSGFLITGHKSSSSTGDFFGIFTGGFTGRMAVALGRDIERFEPFATYGTKWCVSAPTTSHTKSSDNHFFVTDTWKIISGNTDIQREVLTRWDDDDLILVPLLLVMLLLGLLMSLSLLRSLCAPLLCMRGFFPAR